MSINYIGDISYIVNLFRFLVFYLLIHPTTPQQCILQNEARKYNINSYVKDDYEYILCTMIIDNIFFYFSNNYCRCNKHCPAILLLRIDKLLNRQDCISYANMFQVIILYVVFLRPKVICVAYVTLTILPVKQKKNTAQLRGKMRISCLLFYYVGGYCVFYIFPLCKAKKLLRSLQLLDVTRNGKMFQK